MLRRYRSLLLLVAASATFGLVAACVGAVLWRPASRLIRGCPSGPVCDFADTVRAGGNQRSGHEDVGHDGIDLYFAVPPDSDFSTIVTAAGLKTHAPREDSGGMAVVAKGDSTDPKWHGCGLLVLQGYPLVASATWQDPAERERIDTGQLTVIQVSVACGLDRI